MGIRNEEGIFIGHGSFIQIGSEGLTHKTPTHDKPGIPSDAVSYQHIFDD